MSLYVGHQIDRKKLLSLDVGIFFMATAILDSPKNPTSNQLSNNISKQVYKSHLLSNLNANEIYSMHRNEVSN